MFCPLPYNKLHGFVSHIAKMLALLFSSACSLYYTLLTSHLLLVARFVDHRQGRQEQMLCAFCHEP